MSTASTSRMTEAGLGSEAQAPCVRAQRRTPTSPARAWMRRSRSRLCARRFADGAAQKAIEIRLHAPARATLPGGANAWRGLIQISHPWAEDMFQGHVLGPVPQPWARDGGGARQLAPLTASTDVARPRQPPSLAPPACKYCNAQPIWATISIAETMVLTSRLGRPTRQDHQPIIRRRAL